MNRQRQGLNSLLPDFKVHNLSFSAEKPLERNRRALKECVDRPRAIELKLFVATHFSQPQDPGLSRKLTSAKSKIFFLRLVAFSLW
jgi:hypothetical protein